MKKLKVMTVVGTRPEIIRMSCILRRFDSSEAIEHTLVHTGQNYDYELGRIFFDDMGLRLPDCYLDAAGANGVETVGKILIAIDRELAAVKPDVFVVLGDTNSALSAIAAKRRHIPVFHLEAGNRCFDERVPEETNRRIVDHISDLNMTYSTIARDYLLREGLPADRVIKVGSPMREVYETFRTKIEQSDILDRLALEQRGYFVVSAHREENIDNPHNFDSLVETINTIAATFHKPVIVSTHPRTRRMTEERGVVFDPLVRLLKPLSYSDYNRLQMGADTVLSDSGTISEESNIMGFDAVNLREAHERPEAMEQAAVVMTGMNCERVMQAIVQNGEMRARGARAARVADYDCTDVSDKVLRIVLSYTDYIRRKVWFEE